jgi:sortase A
MECVSDGIRRVVRVLGLLMIVVGFGAAAWGLVVWRWQDPFTAVYTTYEQHKLAHRYRQQAERFLATAPHEATHPRVGHAAAPPKQLVRKVQSVAGEELVIDRAARRYRLSTHTGDPVGRIKVPRMGLDIIVVNGTDESSLERGPGRELHTFMPGEGRLVYIAGHRTTYLAPFSHIDALRRGDRITLELPYATFVYRVTRHVIVTADDRREARSRGAGAGLLPVLRDAPLHRVRAAGEGDSGPRSRSGLHTARGRGSSLIRRCGGAEFGR